MNATSIRDSGSYVIGGSFNNSKRCKSYILNYLLRNYTINQLIENREDIFKEIAKKSNYIKEKHISWEDIKDIFDKFYNSIILCKKFYNNYNNLKAYDLNNFFFRTRIRLHKIYKITPIFDFKRALHNLYALQKLFIKNNFRPKISTHLALTIYITDLKRTEDYMPPLIQKNIQFITNCSAYAFHRNRNKIKEILNIKI